MIIKNEIVTQKGIHVCKPVSLIKSEIPQAEVKPEDYVLTFVEDKANTIHLYPNEIYEQLLVALRDKYKNTPYTIPSRDNVYNKIRSIRKIQNFNTIQSVINPPHCYALDEQPFFRRLWVGDIHGKYHTVMIWATNQSLSLLRYNNHTFIDATFRSTPLPFSQCLIIMTFDYGTEQYVPCVYALMTGKHEYLYSVVLHEVIFLLEFKWMPKHITADFEMALIKAI